jgi:hypothetical protein
VTAPVLADPYCLCGCLKSKHNGKGMCRACGEFDCDRFEEDEHRKPVDLAALDQDLAELEATDPTVRVAAERLDEAVASIRHRAATESTSAALRRVEKERDQLLHQIDRINQQARQRDDLTGALKLAEKERDDARADLASAHAALERLRQEAGTGLVLERQHRWLCPACGSRYSFANTEHGCGPLTPITVTTTRGHQGS